MSAVLLHWTSYYTWIFLTTFQSIKLTSEDWNPNQTCKYIFNLSSKTFWIEYDTQAIHCLAVWMQGHMLDIAASYLFSWPAATFTYICSPNHSANISTSWCQLTMKWARCKMSALLGTASWLNTSVQYRCTCSIFISWWWCDDGKDHQHHTTGISPNQAWDFVC